MSKRKASPATAPPLLPLTATAAAALLMYFTFSLLYHHRLPLHRTHVCFHPSMLQLTAFSDHGQGLEPLLCGYQAQYLHTS